MFGFGLIDKVLNGDAEQYIGNKPDGISIVEPGPRGDKWSQPKLGKRSFFNNFPSGSGGTMDWSQFIP